MFVDIKRLGFTFLGRDGDWHDLLGKAFFRQRFSGIFLAGQAKGILILAAHLVPSSATFLCGFAHRKFPADRIEQNQLSITGREPSR